MNPLCLLLPGRTYKQLEERPGAYKLLARCKHTKSDAQKRYVPVAPKSKEAMAQATLFGEQAVAKPAEVVSTTSNSLTIPKEEKFTKASKVDVSSSPFTKEAVTDNDHKKIGFFSKIIGFFIHFLKQIVLWPKSSQAQRPTVQTELALEKVTVLKNDLNEDDLEVVLVERKVGTGEKPLARLSKEQMTGDAWNRLTAPFRKKSSDGASKPKAVMTSPGLGAPS